MGGLRSTGGRCGHRGLEELCRAVGLMLCSMRRGGHGPAMLAPWARGKPLSSAMPAAHATHLPAGSLAGATQLASLLDLHFKLHSRSAC